jgi:SPP1 family phage portal protein
VWRDVNITFTRNLPVNVVEAVDVVNKLRGLVSDETLIAQIPFIRDAAEEVEKIKE